MVEYRLTPAAERDMEAIWKYTRQRWDVEQADRYIDLLTATFVELAHASETAPACNQIRPGYRSRSVERHMVYFRIAAYGIAILHIFHERIGAARHLCHAGRLSVASIGAERLDSRVGRPV